MYPEQTNTDYHQIFYEMSVPFLSLFSLKEKKKGNK